MPEPDCFLRYRIRAATRNFITSGNPKYTYWPPVPAATRSFKMVLFTASRRNTFVGGTCALLSALLVYIYNSLQLASHLAVDPAPYRTVNRRLLKYY